MKRIFLCLLSGFLFKLSLLENTIALYASENTFSSGDSFKRSRYLVDYTPFFLPIKQNGTERNLCVTLEISGIPKNSILKTLVRIIHARENNNAVPGYNN